MPQLYMQKLKTLDDMILISSSEFTFLRSAQAKLTPRCKTHEKKATHGELHLPMLVLIFKSEHAEILCYSEAKFPRTKRKIMKLVSTSEVIFTSNEKVVPE